MQTTLPVFFLLSLDSLIHAATILTPIYPPNGVASGEALDQGNIYKIQWGYNACIGGIVSIVGFQWNNGTEILGSCNAGQCGDVDLIENEQINAYRIIHNPGVNQIYFKSNLGNEWHCGSPYGTTQYSDSGWITYQNYYLSGFKWSAGWILDRVQFQFTMNPTQSPTRDPTNDPTQDPTNDPTGDPTNDPTNNPTRDPTNYPTRDPTHDPTQDPTNNPTTEPTMEPTDDPTTDPTNIPSSDPTTKPSISPTKAPTNTRSGSVETSTTPNADYDRDLTINVNATNGTFNQYHVIRRVNTSLNALLDTGYTLTADIIKPNVSINVLVDIHDDEREINEINTEELSQRIQEDLNKDSDIIYVVEVRENDETVEVMDNPFGFDNFNELMIGICAFLMLIILISYIDSKWCRINDYHRMGALIIAILQLLDMIYDCLFSVQITLDPDYSITSPSFTLLMLSIAFIVIPMLITLIQLHFEMKEWKRNDELSQWMFDNTVLLYIISAICGSSFVAVRVCCSNLLNLSYFDIPLSQMQKSAFYTKRIYSSVMLENVPQLVIQTIYLLSISSSNGRNNDIVYASMAFSLLSIIISILSMVTQKNLLKSRDYVTIDFDVKGEVILSNWNKCRNRYKILRNHLSLIFGINCSMIEIKKPSQIPNGLRVHIIIHINNTKAIDINCDKLIKDANKSGKLGKILKESWSLSITPIISNIKYTKYDSQDRKDNTVNIKAMSSQQINNNNDKNYMMDGNPINTMPINTIPINMIQMTTIPPLIPPVNVTLNGENDMNDNQNLPALIPPVVVSDYGENNNNYNYNDTNNMEDSHQSNDGKQAVVYDTEDKDDDVVQYINNVDNMTVGI